MKNASARSTSTCCLTLSNTRHGRYEADVLLWIGRGKAYRKINDIPGISPRTVNKHLEQVSEKMGIENRVSPTAAAVKTLIR